MARRNSTEEIARPPAPSHLTPAAQAKWTEVIARQRMWSAGRLTALTVAFEALDRLREVQAVIAAEGLFTTTTRSGVKHVHPAVTLEMELRRQFTTLWRGLHLNWETLVDGRM